MNNVQNRIIIIILLSVLAIVGVGSINILYESELMVKKIENSNSYKIEIPAPKYIPPEYSFGGRTLLPNYRLVGLYGSPTYPSLGALGEQDLAKTIKRVKKLASKYQQYSTETIVPMLEIIVTVASASPTDNNDYSQEIEIKNLKTWIEAAQESKVYVVLDLQPGRTDFLTQAKKYSELLEQTNVGLALDPEWRLKNNEIHLQQIGSVDVNEVNKTAQWLAKFTKEKDLPQKLFMLHQFKDSMIINRQNLDTSSQDLAYLIQMDGNGAQGSKLETWKNLINNDLKNVYYGWKNFYDEDLPVRSPSDTMKIVPTPHFVSYQ